MLALWWYATLRCATLCYGGISTTEIIDLCRYISSNPYLRASLNNMKIMSMYVVHAMPFLSIQSPP